MIVCSRVYWNLSAYKKLVSISLSFSRFTDAWSKQCTRKTWRGLSAVASENVKSLRSSDWSLLLSIRSTVELSENVTVIGLFNHGDLTDEVRSSCQRMRSSIKLSLL